MTGPIYPLPPRVPRLEHAAFKLWTIRQLLREGALDPVAAQTSAEILGRHPNKRIAALAAATESDIADRAIAALEQRA